MAIVGFYSKFKRAHTRPTQPNQPDNQRIITIATIFIGGLFLVTSDVYIGFNSKQNKPSQDGTEMGKSRAIPSRLFDLKLKSRCSFTSSRFLRFSAVWQKPHTVAIQVETASWKATGSEHAFGARWLVHSPGLVRRAPTVLSESDDDDNVVCGGAVESLYCQYGSPHRGSLPHWHPHHHHTHTHTTWLYTTSFSLVEIRNIFPFNFWNQQSSIYQK